MKFIFYCLIIMLFPGVRVAAQDSVKTIVLQPQRFEKERKFSEDDFSIILLKEEGLALIRDKNKFKSGNKVWELVLLDTTLQEAKTIELEIDQRKNLVGFEYAPGFLYLIYNNADNLKIALSLVEVQLSTGEIKQYSINPELALKLSHFIKVGNNFVFGGYVNTEPTILLFNSDSENIKVLPGFFQKQTELVDLRANQNQTFNAILIDRGDRDRKKIIIKTFDATGIELLNDGIMIDDQYTLLTSLSSKLVREDLAVVGTWGGRNAKQASGFYFLSVDPFSEQKIKYTALGELEHYLDKQKPKRAKRIKDKTRDALKQNRIPDFANYVVPYRIIEHPSAFIMLAETIIPASSSQGVYRDPYTYTYGPNPFYSPWGFYPRSYYGTYDPYSTRRTMSSTDEIRVSQSVLVAFDSNGNILWDLNFNHDNTRVLSLEQIADFYVENDKLFFLYKKESELYIKSVTLQSLESNDSSVLLKLSDEGDEIRSEEKLSGAVRHWYGNTFYVWGQHTIRNKSSRDEASRNVFYINKVVLR